MEVYLDHAATTPVDPRVLEALRPWLEREFGNPSSRHRAGLRAREALETARAQVARAAGARREDVIFTSGGTEANALAVLGAARARARRGRHVLIGPTEHACVRAAAGQLAAEGRQVEELRLDGRGALDLEHAGRCLRPDTVLVAQMLVQNEFGSLYPLRELVRLARARAPQAHVHSDAVQALGKTEVSLAELGCDSLAVSSHKVHGPKGCGALIRAEGLPLTPLCFGGGQEQGLRPGTENVPGLVGFGLAAELAERERPAFELHATALRAQLAAGLAAIPGARLLEPGAPVQPTCAAICALLLPGAPAQVRVNHLEQRGFLASAGSACQARQAELSPALLALKLGADEARCVLRLSFARTTTAAEVTGALAALEQVCTQLANRR